MHQAYVTLISGGSAYEPGAETLGRSLRATGSQVPRVLLATPDVPEATIERLKLNAGWVARRIEPIGAPVPEGHMLFSRFRNTYTKLRAFGLAEFEKLVFLDADTLVLQNIDELFEHPDFAAAPDFFMPDRFNSGVMVLRPSQSRFEAMMAALRTSDTYDGGDQGFLNEFFPDWWTMDAGHRLPARYNLHHFVFQFLEAHSVLRRQFLQEVKIIHYTLQKPWLQMTLTGASKLWWDTYLEDRPERIQVLHRKLHALEDWTFDRLVSVLGGA